jgi:prepilin-type N-terminal cleavage/methylation domain-containing protein
MHKAIPHGFSLVESLVVMAIIALLASFLFIAFGQALKKAQSIKGGSYRPVSYTTLAASTSEGTPGSAAILAA